MEAEVVDKRKVMFVDWNNLNYVERGITENKEYNTVEEEEEAAASSWILHG